MKKYYYKNLIKEETGATSVLVLLMMIVLVALGSFTIASANSNIKLSKTSTQWNLLYYGLDSKGEEYLKDVDKALYNAQQLAVEYMAERQFMQLTHKDLPVEIQSSIREELDESEDKNQTLIYIYNSLYYFYANKNLDELKINYPDNIVSTLAEEDIINTIMTDIMFSDEENPDFVLNIVLEILPPEYSFMDDGSTIVIENMGNKRYSVSNWMQKQTLPIIKEESLKVWDGKLPIK